MTPQEEAHMVLVHDVLSLSSLADDVPEIRKVVGAAMAACQELEGKWPHATVLSCWPDQYHVEQELYYIIGQYNLSITADELYTLVAQEMQKFIEFRLEHLYDYIANSSEDWVRTLRDRLCLSKIN